MRKLCTLIASIAILLGTSQLSAQTRYLDEIFTDVTVTDGVTYGVNISILPIVLGQSATPLPEELLMDVYEPVGDTLAERPLLLFAITGTFFPPIVNGGFTGGLKDSLNVEFATRMAKRGYVVAVVQYRQGWNAIGPVIEQQKTILQAAYRGIQDIRTAVRYFRMTAAEAGNPYRIDSEKIGVGGNGTGNYVSYGATYFQRYEQALLQKFIDFDVDPPTPFIIEQVHGDPYGVDTALLNIPNHTGYSSEFNVGFGLGGALGDQSWVDSTAATAVPFIAAHAWKNPLAPPGVGDVLATNPDTGEPFAVIPTASGPYSTLGRATELGLQTIFDSVDWAAAPFDEFEATVSSRAAEINEGATGFYPFITPFTPGDAECLGTGVPGDTLTQWVDPYGWFDPQVAEATWNFVFAEAIANQQQITGAQAVCRNERGAPNTAESAKAYIDTVVAFMAPRLGVVMELFEYQKLGATSRDKYIQDANIAIFPNPTQGRISVVYEGGAKMIESVTLMDYTGRTISHYPHIRQTEFQLERTLPKGIYLLRVETDDAFTMQRVVFE